ncbi:MAG: MFS transporter [Myxococcales bacterium]|nr:MFS transporter [Myxococcales bacterium]
MSESSTARVPFTTYQKQLFVFLSVATFFEGYDFFALTQILPEVAREFQLTKAEGGALIAVINVGTVLACLLVRRADRWGRKRVLTYTIAGYTCLTFLTGLTTSVWTFAAFQLVARTFLIAEWAVSMVFAAEEFPPERRGMVIGVIQAFASLGAIVCAGVVPFLLHTPYGWRSVYFVGILPLVILAFARRGLRESSRFAADVGDRGEARPLLAILKSKHRKRVLQLALIWALTYVSTQNAVTFWKLFAMEERGFSESDVGLAISIAAVASMPLVFGAGKLLDVVGRRPGALIIYTLAIAGVLGCYSLHGFWPLTISLVLGIFGASAVLPVLNAFNTELFPTAVRADAFAWANNLLGRIGYVVSPVFVAAAADTIGWGPAVRLTTIGPVLAVILILALLPETRARELGSESPADGDARGA